MIKRIKDWIPGFASEPAKPELSILMVCSGNICRSPTAEAVLRSQLKRAGLNGVRVGSAGTHGYHLNEAPDPRAQAAALRRGYDLSKLRARPVTEADFHQFDRLYAMDATHLAWLQKRLPQVPAAQAQAPRPQLRLLVAHARRFKGASEVPDPYYGNTEGFERVLDLVEDACDGLVHDLILQRRGR
jgi:protein-tyrosine phosphatase